MNMDVIEEKLSVIIPVYNCREWIQRCLDSVMKQTYRNLEILVIDDGSDDGSGEIIGSFAEEDSRIQYFSQENKGAASARNKGLLQASGTFVTFVDADDYIEKDMYEKMLAAMREQDGDIVECSCRQVDSDGKILLNMNLQKEVIVGKRQCVKHYLRQKNTANYTWNKIYRRNLLNGLLFPNLKYSEDYYINALAHARAGKKIILTDVLYNYVLHHGQATDISHVSMSNFDGVRSGRLVAEFIRKDKELCTYASVYSCEYAIRTAGQYLRCYPDHWKEVKRHIKADFLYCCMHMSAVNTDIDVLAKRRQYLRFFLKGEIDRGIYVQALPQLVRKEKQQEKCSRLFRLMCRWTMNVQKGIRAADFLKKREWLSVAVYGAGDVGKCLLAELTDSDIEVRYVIDRRQMELNLLVYRPEDALPAVDCVIVTAVMDYGEISMNLKNKLNCCIISIEDIVYWEE